MEDKEKKEEVKVEEVKEEVPSQLQEEVKDTEIKPKEKLEVKAEVPEAKTSEKEIKLSKFSDIFITEKDTFDIVVKYYKKDGVLYVKEVDDEFDDKEPCIDFSITFKYPDQGDTARITTGANRISADIENIDVRDLINLEFSRVLCLIRKWVLDKKLTNENILQLHPKIIKAIVVQIRDLIGMDGII